MKEQGVLVTGGAGFIGSNLVEMLLETGHTVYVLDDLSTGKMENLDRWMGHERFNFIRGDIREPLDNSLTPSRLGNGPPIKVVFHLAARVDVTSSFLDPRGDLSVNYLGTMNVLDHAVRSGIGKVIFTSSAAVYGDTDRLPVKESEPTMPLSPYGLHKSASESLIAIHHEHFGLNYAILRLFNVFGPRQDPSNPYSGVISKFLERSRKNEPLMLYGTGDQTRDFVYVGDVSRVLIDAAGSDVVGTFNVATGKETSVNDLAGMVEQISGKQLKRVFLPKRKGEILRSVADISLLGERLGFSEFTGLKDGMRDTYRWFEKRN